GEDGRPFKTRSGDTVGLEELLDEAERRALEVLQQVAEERESPLSPEQQASIARVVGIGALKYADLSQNRQTDYKFSFAKMLELKGNTATYLQYLYARVQGIYRKAGIRPESLASQANPLSLTTEVERQLAVGLLRFGEALNDVLVDYRPNLLAQYLFDLSQTFFKFYNLCSVLQAETEGLRISRLKLCELTARTVKQGLNLLGIEVVEQM
ncbi:MAG TPA: arginine--tRNA ligase, partial [Pirellulaceae bacterium]|nr:arginine--tRNA ligase [Pirellulaceae bacterium]